MNVKNIILCTATILFIWSLYGILIAVIVPDISLRSKLFMAVAFSIPSVITLGSALCKHTAE